MGRLTSLPSRATLPSSRIGYTKAKEPAGPPTVQANAPWRKLYNTRRWAETRQEVLIRDAYTCRMCGRVCGGKSPAPDSPVVDHIRPHRGDERLFWPTTNLQTLCKSPCHDRHKQRQEQESRRQQGVWD